MTRTHEKAKAKGFTLIEMAIDLVIIGILLSAAGIGWYSLLEGRRLAKTYGTLVQAKECLIKRMLYSNQYPSYTANLDCDDETAPYAFDLSAKDVDACLCNLRDAWGKRLYFIEGRASNSTGSIYYPLSQGTKYVADNLPQNATATNPDSGNSTITDKDGNTIKYIAFVLVSSGKNLYLDHDSYRSLFTPPSHVATLDTGNLPDFFSDPNGTPPVGDPDVRDDIILTVTGPELMTLLTE